MVDVGGVRTREQLRVALKRVCGHLSYDALAERSKIPKTTLHGILSEKTAAFPRWSTLQPVLVACGVTDRELHAWKDAYERAKADDLGRPLEEIDPFALEVHRPISAGSVAGLPLLPRYVRRAHDDLLAEVVNRAAGGENAMAVLVAGSSAGKTRALWEALTPLRDAGGWRLWHPRSPTRRVALDDWGRVRPRTVVWLNETQEYLGGTTSGGDEPAAAALRDLLADSTRAPVLILGTLWPVHHDRLSSEHASQARKLLEDNVIEVPDSFASTDLDALRDIVVDDPRLALALERAEDGQVTQYLAGGPELVARYRFSSSPAAKAIIEVAMDARRMGHGTMLPHALFEEAAHAYMTSMQWDCLSEDWLEQALAETSQPCRGARGPLTRVRPRPGTSRVGRRTAAATRDSGTADGRGPLYQLADYLDQFGRTDRADQIPPIGFWEAVALHAGPQDLTTLGGAAHGRGLYRDSAQLWKNAALHGDLKAARNLTRLLHLLYPDDERPAVWAGEHVGLDNAYYVAEILDMLRESGASDAVDQLARRAASTVALDDASGVAKLMDALWEADASDAVGELARRAATAAAFNNMYGVADLVKALRKAGERDAVGELARRGTTAAAFDNPFDVALLMDALPEAVKVDFLSDFLERRSAELDNPSNLAQLLVQLQEMGASEAVAELSRRAATTVALDNPFGVAELMDALREAGECDAVGQLARRTTSAGVDTAYGVASLMDALREAGEANAVGQLARRAATTIALDDPREVAKLMDALREAGESNAIGQLALRAATTIALDDAYGVADLVNALRKAGKSSAVGELAQRAAAAVALDDAFGVANLVNTLRKAGESNAIGQLALRAASAVALDTAGGVANLIDALREAGQSHAVAELAQRAAAAVALDNPREVANLMDALWEASETHAIGELARRAASAVALDNPRGVAWLMDALREAGESDAVAELARRTATAVPLDNPRDVADLVYALRETGESHAVGELARRTLGNASDAARLVNALREAGQSDQLRDLARRAATTVALDDASSIVNLVNALQEAGESDAVAELARRAAITVALDDASSIADLVNALREAGESDAVAELARRAATAVALDDAYTISRLVHPLWQAGATHELSRRLPAAGLFEEFLRICERPAEFRFGRESDGNIAAAWSWDDLA
ncbi:hypothetical protein ACQP1G_22035 [Nocardia sp. CA-107356]|uniref:hypothetical protein n=1 Tax=Nocardia sp. CA-107356 TaxID=3239972 RepID=UPI003D8E139B